MSTDEEAIRLANANKNQIPVLDSMILFHSASPIFHINLLLYSSDTPKQNSFSKF